MPFKGKVKIIAFGHRRRAGKDTAVNVGLSHLKSNGICNAYGLSFFNQIKDIAAGIYGWGGLEDAVYYENYPEKKEIVLPPIGKSPRDIWIELGETINGICPITLCEMAFRKLTDGIYLIRDLRRPIEADYIKKFGGILVQVINPNVPRYDDIVDSALDGYTGWDAHLVNDGTLKDYVGKVKTLLNHYLL